MLVKHLLAYKKYETVDQFYLQWSNSKFLLDHFELSKIFSHVCYQSIQIHF